MSHHWFLGRSGRVKRVVGFRGADLSCNLWGAASFRLSRVFRGAELSCDFHGISSPRGLDLFGLEFVMTMILIRIGSYTLRITGCMGWGNGKHVAE